MLKKQLLQHIIDLVFFQEKRARIKIKDKLTLIVKNHFTYAVNMEGLF